jgi:hypothetical protein
LTENLLPQPEQTQRTNPKRITRQDAQRGHRTGLSCFISSSSPQPFPARDARPADACRSQPTLTDRRDGDEAAKGRNDCRQPLVLAAEYSAFSLEGHVPG